MAEGSEGRLGWLQRRVWQVMLAGQALVGAGFVLASWQPDLVPARLILLIAGLVTVASAIRLRFQETGWGQVEDRLETASFVALGAFASLGAFVSMETLWDSGRIFLGVLTVIGLLGSILVVLPTRGRKVAISLLIVLHFGGILTAVTTIEPPGAAAPWVSAQIWTRFYRPYLQTFYLNNAYHFYSPEPGPPSLLWFHITYASGKRRWVKIPSRETSPTPLYYQRMLALTESAAQVSTQQPSDEVLSALRLRREKYGQIVGIPLHPVLPTAAQRREPLPYSKMMLSAYARHVARHYPSPEGEEEDPIENIKVYRVVHSIISAAQLAGGVKPWDKVLYFPYYQGEYDAEGKLLDPTDPMLYWLIPILPDPDQPDGVRDYLQTHVGVEWQGQTKPAERKVPGR